MDCLSACCRVPRNVKKPIDLSLSTLTCWAYISLAGMVVNQILDSASAFLRRSFWSGLRKPCAILCFLVSFVCLSHPADVLLVNHIMIDNSQWVILAYDALGFLLHLRCKPAHQQPFDALRSSTSSAQLVRVGDSCACMQSVCSKYDADLTVVGI